MEILIHNLLAVVPAIVVLLMLSRIVLTLVLRVLDRLTCLGVHPFQGHRSDHDQNRGDFSGWARTAAPFELGGPLDRGLPFLMDSGHLCRAHPVKIGDLERGGLGVQAPLAALIAGVALSWPRRRGR
jgi:hypothetical protein